jgi:hypothetical protein
MNKIIISLIALGAFSGAAFAEAGDLDREGVAEFYVGGAANDNNTVTKPFAVADESGLTAFQKVIMSGKGDGSDR